MADFLFLHHDDAGEMRMEDWGAYIGRLQAQGVFQGGSAIGEGMVRRKAGKPRPLTTGVYGYLRVTADDLDGAGALLAGHPSYEAGGTVEIRELPRS